MRKTVGILTPAYNRAYIMDVLFESLLAQTSYDFNWYIIDDGSTHDTKEKCESFKTDKFNITYVYKENGGKHTAINTGLDLIDDELVFIVDSDDRLTEDAVETIARDWERYKDRKDVGGLCYYKMKPDLSVVGDGFGEEGEFVDGHINVRFNRGVSGDKAEVFRADVLKRHKFPVFEGEKFLSESIVWAAINRSGYNLAFIPKGIYICEYHADGLTKEGKKKVIKNPLGYIEHAKSYLHSDIIQKLQWKYILMYIAVAFFSERKMKDVFRECPRKMKFICAFLPGYALYIYWKRKWGGSL